MNNLYNQINNSNRNLSLPNNLQQVKNMMNMFRNTNNPQALLENMIKQNPQMRNVMNIIQQNGGDPKTAFYNTAKQKGIDPQQILNMLK